MGSLGGVKGESKMLRGSLKCYVGSQNLDRGVKRGVKMLSGESKGESKLDYDLRGVFCHVDLVRV